MDCVSVGPWTLQWWQRRMAVLCILLLHQLSAIVHLVQPVWGLPCPSKKFVKASPWKVLPVAVSEYVKSWMRDTPEGQPRSRPTVQWFSNRPVAMRPNARVRKQSSGRNFKPYKRRWIPSEGRMSRGKKHFSKLECLSAIIAMKANHSHQDEVARFDTDAKAIRIDNCASYCISNDKKDFITPLKKINKKLKGLGGTLADIYSGTIKWSIEDDDGVPHDWVIPNLHSIGPRLLKISSLSPEELGVQHTMIVFSFSGLRGSSPRQ